MLPETDVRAAAIPAAASEPASRAMRQAGTSPVLRVSLGAVRANHRELKRRYRGTTLAAVVKSDAYGLGLTAVAPVLIDEGCRDFWVNDLDEAVRLRRGNPGIRIYCLMGLAGARIDDFEAAGAIPALCSLEEIEHCARHASATGRRPAVAIQLDTGLGRLGLGSRQVERLASDPALLLRLEVRLYLSQLASYNLPDDPDNLAQHVEMRRLCALLPSAPISLGASSAVFMEQGWHFDMARTGSALFGVQTSVRFQEGLQPCYRLGAPVLAITEHPAGRRLGYRGSTELRRASRIAVVGIGYANGLPQGFAETGHARIAGVPAPVVGGIAMNLTMLDVTDLPADQPAPGDTAVFFDTAHPLEPVAERLQVAPNVLLTQIGAGTRKVYEDR